MSRQDDDALGHRMWTAETAPLPRLSEIASHPPPGVAARAVVMRLDKPADVGRVFNRNATIFVLMPDPPQVGSTIECVLVHPHVQREAKVMAEVVRVGNTLAGVGAELRFETPGPSLREALVDFVRAR